MLFRKKAPLKVDNLLITLTPRSDYQTLNLEQWQQLAKDAVHTNPFFEHWNLIPALKHIEQKSHIEIVSVYQYNHLVALFPICIEYYFSLKKLTVWKHEHCYLTEPLYLPGIDFLTIITKLCDHFKAHMFGTINCYSDYITLRNSQHERANGYESDRRKVVVQTFHRGAYIKASEHAHWPGNLSIKRQKENRRITNKIHKAGDIQYCQDAPAGQQMFDEYCHLEAKGWKGKAKSAILSRSQDTQYFSEIINNKDNAKHISFQYLALDDKKVAISFRYHIDDKAFEIKTTYDETYKKLNPGVILEIKNLNVLAGNQFSLIDSCAATDNYLINQLWPHRQEVLNLFWFDDSTRASLARRLVSSHIKNKLQP